MKKSNYIVIFVGALLVVGLIYTTTENRRLQKGLEPQNMNQEDINRELKKFNEYEALKLNTRVAVEIKDDSKQYFGIITKTNEEYIVLSDIFYIDDMSSIDVGLTKMGCELRGPQDVLYIFKTSVLYWQPLKESGQVEKAIQDYKETESHKPISERYRCN